MKYVNPPEKSPQNVTHKTFYSQLFNHELGYNIYLPPDYEAGGDAYPVAHFLHGWTGNESSDIWAAEKLYTSGRAIAVFPNNSPVIEERDNLPVEQMLINELIPHIDGEFRTEATRESRSISGFSMGGGMAFYLAVKYPELFSSVTAYAGTFHHYYHKGSQTVGVEPEKAAELYKDMVTADAKAEGYIAVVGFPVIRDERYEWDNQGHVPLIFGSKIYIQSWLKPNFQRITDRLVTNFLIYTV